MSDICENFLEFKDHVLTHPNGKELERMPHFACPVCKKMFRQHSNMRRHHRLHIGISLGIRSPEKHCGRLDSNLRPLDFKIYF